MNYKMKLFYFFALLPLACRGQGRPNRLPERTVHFPQTANDFGFNGFQNVPQHQQAGAITPWWNSDELLPNVLPWLSNQKQPSSEVAVPPLPAPALKESNLDLVNFLNGPDGKDGPMKHIMRVLRILPPKEPISYSPNGQPIPFVPAVPSLSPQFTRPPSIDQICPFGAEPFFYKGQYMLCNPRNISGCPMAYVCDRSALLSEHICCKDRNAPSSLWSTASESSTSTTSTPRPTTSSTIQSTTPTSTSTTTTTTATTTTTETTPSRQSSTGSNIWTVWPEWFSTASTSQPESTTSPPVSPSSQQEKGFNLFKSWPPLPANPFVNFPKYPTPNQFTSTYNKRIWQPIDPNQSTSASSQYTVNPGGVNTPPPWEPVPVESQPLEPQSPFATILPKDKNFSSGELTTINLLRETTSYPSVTVPLNGVEIIPLTVGHVMSIPNGDFEWASTITLIRDGDKTVLVDTGVPADTNILIRELSKHSMRPDNVDIVVITHGHPDHFGNQNLFSRKRQLFSSFEFIGNKFSRTSLVEQQFRKLTSHIEVWKTPGHTPEDLSVIVRDVPTLGTVAVVGDLILNEDFLLNPDQWTNTGSWDRHIQQNNINMIVCMVDCIVPGHGGMFRLHDEHRKNSNCAQRYPIYYANYYG